MASAARFFAPRCAVCPTPPRSSTLLYVRATWSWLDLIGVSLKDASNNLSSCYFALFYVYVYVILWVTPGYPTCCLTFNAALLFERCLLQPDPQVELVTWLLDTEQDRNVGCFVCGDVTMAVPWPTLEKLGDVCDVKVG